MPPFFQVVITFAATTITIWKKRCVGHWWNYFFFFDKKKMDGYYNNLNLKGSFMQLKNENLLPLIFEGTVWNLIVLLFSNAAKNQRSLNQREAPPLPLVGDISATPKVLKSNAFSIKLVDCLRDRFQSVSKQYFPVIILEWGAAIFKMIQFFESKWNFQTWYRLNTLA